MRKELILVLFAIFIALFCGCTKDNEQKEVVTNTSPEENMLKDFAEILSAAVYNEPDLRAFIKKEANKEFDNDFDVFYPYVKDEKVSSNRTFRDILQQYDSQKKLDVIEECEPLLNIYVPDWSWIDEECFSVCNWDTSLPEVLVTYSCPGSEIPLLSNGELIGTLQGNEFTSEPVLVVKRNERLVFHPTKSGPLVYKFISPFYDHNNSLSLETKGEWHDENIDLGASIQNELLPSTKVHLKVRKAYTESKKNTKLPQRDYIYYDMTTSKDTGKVDCTFVEQLYRFRFKSANLGALADDTSTDNQMKFNSVEYKYGNDMTMEEIKGLTWIDGDCEIIIRILAGNITISKVLPSIKLKDMFDVKAIQKTWYRNIFGVTSYRYYSIKKEDLLPKWLDIKVNLFTWDLSHLPCNYIIEFEEQDSGVTITNEETFTYAYATNFNASGEASIDKVKIGFGTGMSSQNTKTLTTKYQTQEKNDNLGSAVIQYINPIIASMVGGTKVKLFTYSTSSVDFQIEPVKVLY